MRISVIGGGTVPRETTRIAEEVGRLIGERGHTLVCGGAGGVMEAACGGAVRAGGETIGILPTERRADANSHVTIPIATGLGHARNALVVMNGDAVVAIDGRGGTLSELGFSAIYERPVAGINAPEASWIEPVDSPDAAIAYVEAAVE